MKLYYHLLLLNKDIHSYKKNKLPKIKVKYDINYIIMKSTISYSIVTLKRKTIVR